MRVTFDSRRIKKKYEEFHFQVGVFKENTKRSKVSHKKSAFIKIKKLSAKTGVPSYRQTFRTPQTESKMTNAQLFQYEVEKGRNYLLDTFKYSHSSSLISILQNYVFQKNNLNLQQACQLLVGMVRSFIEKNPYNKHNAPSTIRQKHQDKWFIDSRQAQMSVRARFMSKNTIIASPQD